MKAGINKLQVVIIALVILSNLIFQFFPLVSEFSYEFSVANALLLSFLFPYFNLSFRTVYKQKYLLILILLAPILISTIFNINSTCPFVFGLKYYVFIYLFTILNIFIINEISIFINLSKRKIIYYFVILVIILVSLLEVIFRKQIYSYNLLIGYFPGTLYDDFIPINVNFIFYRIVSLSTIFIIYFLFKYNSRLLATYLTAIFTIFYIVIFKPILGFSTSEHNLIRYSKSIISSPNFNIYLGWESKINEAKYIAMEHEYSKKYIENKLGDKLNFRINSYIFNDKYDKQSYFGSSAADVSKPWQNSIFTDRNTFANTLTHELVHAYSKKYGASFLHLAGDINFALIEGLAVAVEDEFINQDLFSASKMMFENGRKIELRNLFICNDFFSYSPALSYLYSGSYVKYLIQKYGIEKFHKYYETNDFFSTYNKKFREIENDFWEHIKNIEVKTDSSFLKIVTQSKSVFSKKCKHYIAEKLFEADKLEIKKDEEEINKILTNLWQENKNMGALFRLIKNNLIIENYTQANDLIEKNSEIINSSNYEYVIKYFKAIIYLVDSNFIKSTEILDDIIFNSNSDYLVRKSKILLDFCKNQQAINYIVLNKEKKLNAIETISDGKYSIYQFLELNELLEFYEIEHIFNKINWDEGNNIADLISLSEYYLRNLQFDKIDLFIEKLSNYNASYKIQKQIQKLVWYKKNKNLIEEFEIYAY